MNMIFIDLNLKRIGETMFNRFDICEAAYLFATFNHQGQWSPEYKIFGRLARIGFKPSPLLSLETASDEVIDCYYRFAKHYKGR